MKKDVVWGYIAQFLQFGVALIALPALLRSLSSAELGVWYVLVTISMLVDMLDMGFTPTMGRSVCFVLGGARKLHRDGHELVTEGNPDVDYGLLRALIKAAKRIFGVIAATALVLLATFGTWFILDVTRAQIPVRTMTIAWAIFVPATIINLYYKYFTPLLQGRGLFGAYYRSLAISKTAFVIVVIVSLHLGFGLIGVASGFLISALVGRVLSARYLYDREFKHLLAQAQDASISLREMFLTLWNNAWRLGLVVVGGFLALRANNLTASAFLGLAVTSQYALTNQMFAAVTSVAYVIMSIQMQKMSQQRVVGNMVALRKRVSQSLVVSLLIYVAGAAFIIILGPTIITMIGGHTQILSRPQVIAIALVLLLGFNHQLTLNVIETGNTVPFVKATILSGIGVVAIATVGLKFGNMGVWWLIACQFLVPACYNNWKWPSVVGREFNTSYFTLLTEGLSLLAVRLRGRARYFVQASSVNRDAV
jgi:O-antigen/teichoic acid export membrane protein